MGRAAAIWQQHTVARALNIQPDPWLRLLMTLIWAALFLGMVVALGQKRPFARRLTPFLMLTYGLVNPGLLALTASTPPPLPQWLLEIVLYGGAILYSFWALKRVPAQLYFTH